MLYGCRCCLGRLRPPPPNHQSSTLPLVSLLLDATVRDGLVTIQSTQYFRNESSTPLECALKLPVEENVCISELTVTTEDGRVLKAKVQEKEQAKENYSDAISSGNTAVYGEVKDDKEFQISVGNLAPQTGLKTTIELVLPVECVENRWLFALPKWLMPSWQKNPVSAAQLQALPIDQQRERLGFTLKLEQSATILDVRSPTHQLCVTYDSSRLQASVVLSPTDPLPSQSSIRIEYLTATDSSPRLQLEQDPASGEYAGMLSFIPPLLSQDERVEDLEGVGDFVLILDRSGSMAGQPIEMAKQAVVLFIKSLSEGSKFNIVSFGSQYRKMFPQSQPVTSQSVATAIQQITEFRADFGGTNILSPLQAVYQEASDPALPRSLYLLTDGQVENRDAVVHCIAEHSKQARVHAFGIGSSVDRALIIQCARAARGTEEFILASEDIKRKVVTVLKKAILPAFSDLRVTWPSGEQFPSNRFLPVCYFGECVLAFVHFGVLKPTGSAGLRCVHTGKQQEVACDVDLNVEVKPGKNVHKLWAKYAMKELTQDYVRTNDPALVKRVQEISIKYGVPSEYTAFLCVQENQQPVVGSLQATTITLVATAAQQAPQYGGFALFGAGPPHPIAPTLSTNSCSPTMPMPPISRGMPMSFGMSAPGGPPQGMAAPPVMGRPQIIQACMPMNSPPPPGASRSANLMSFDSPPMTNYTPTQPSSVSTSLERATLMDLVTKQELDGHWSSAQVQVSAAQPAEVTSADVWTTLCVVVYIERKFAAQAEEWQLVVRKARKWLDKAGVSLQQHYAAIQAQLRL